MTRLRLVQLPVPPPAALAATGNVPLAAGSLAVSARVHGLTARGLSVEVATPGLTDALGDTRLADWIARDEPEFVGFSLYLWNVERSLHLAREVKRRSPRTRVLVGGPEVSADNPFLLAQAGFDIAVTGEAEDTFARLMDHLLDGRDVVGLPGVAVRGAQGLGPFGPPPTVDFPLTDYPSPYLEGLVPVEAGRSTYVESVRGCRSHCTFCFYPRSSNVLRTLDVDRSAALIARLRDLGAREVVFLDPTFNHRPQFGELLDAVAAVNADRRLSFFAEVRSEGMTPEYAAKLARAGFTKLEIGLQSVNRETLKRVKRGGNPDKVAAAAKMLHAEGIELMVDLIIGLPGDTPDDVARGIDFLFEHDMGAEAQVFPLCLLPGTAMRADAEKDGLVYDPTPPYRIQRTPTMDRETMAEVLDAAEERLGRRLDEFPRPHLVEADGEPDVFVVDVDDAASVARAAAPGAQHVALWLSGADLFARRDVVMRAIDARLEVDPFATLDVVLSPRTPFPLDLIDLVRRKLASGLQSYASRALAHRGEDLQRRVSVVLPAGARFPRDWVEALMDEASVWRDQTLRQAADRAADLGDTLPAARILDRDLDPDALRALADSADPESVAFAHRPHEIAWSRGVLRYGDDAA